MLIQGELLSPGQSLPGASAPAEEVSRRVLQGSL